MTNAVLYSVSIFHCKEAHFEIFLPVAAPSPPRNLTALSITNTRYNMSWLPPLTPNGVVQLYRVSISRATTDAQNTSDTSVILDLDEAPSGTAFFVTVQAFTVAFGAASSEVTIIIRKRGMPYIRPNCTMVPIKALHCVRI